MLLLALACTQDSQLTAIKKELAVSPSVADAGQVALGDSVEVTLQLDNLQGGDISVRNISLTAVEGEGFDVDDWDEVVSAGGTGYATLSFTPPSRGYHRALIEVTSDADNNLGELQIRGFCGEPRLRGWPASLDFGFVEPGEVSELEFTLSGGGDMPTTVRAWDIDLPVYEVLDDELAVPQGEQRLITVRFSPVDEEPADAELTVLSDADELPFVLRGNSCTGPGEDGDGDGYTICGGDCDDDDDDVHPGATESADGVDEDCNGLVDDRTDAYDDDGDGESEDDGDCNDGDPEVFSTQEETRNGVDDDCDGVIDDGVGNLDSDGDGYLEESGDCDNDDPTVFPGAPELEDGLDNDCDGDVDEGTADYDDDGDGETENEGDCDDTDASVYSSATEAQDHLDNDCDGIVDEGTNRYDDDGDGFTEQGGDCDDDDSSVHPAAIEVDGDGVDNDCDGDAD